MGYNNKCGFIDDSESKQHRTRIADGLSLSTTQHGPLYRTNELYQAGQCGVHEQGPSIRPIKYGGTL
jgi:hypothetical protein